MPEEQPSAFTRANRDRWNRVSDVYQRENRSDLEDDLVWGPSMPPEEELRILGEVSDRDILEVGCGGGQSAVYLAERGARVVGVDFSTRQLAHAKALADSIGVGVRFIESNAEDLSMLEDGSFDIAFSAFAYGFVERIARAFREVHRLLRPGGLFAFSWGSPLWAMTTLLPDETLVLHRSYFDRTPFVEEDDVYGTEVDFPRTYGDWHGALTQADFVVTDIVEPEPVPRENTWIESHPLAMIRMVPGTTIWRARKPPGHEP